MMYTIEGGFVNMNKRSTRLEYFNEQQHLKFQIESSAAGVAATAKQFLISSEQNKVFIYVICGNQVAFGPPVKIGTIQRRLAWSQRMDDMYS